MDVIKQLITQLTTIWGRWNRLQQVGIVAVTLLCVAGIAGVGMWASTREFVTLTNHLSPAEAHDIVSALEAESIEYELNFAGSAVSVPIGDVSRARLAIKELGHDVPEDLDDSGGWWSDPTQQRSRQQRSLERRLAASISQLKPVRSATVHITQAETSPFIREQAPAKASVVLQLVPGSLLTGSDAQAIVSLVSHSVENLAPEDTMVVDTEGNLLSGDNSIGADVTGQLEYQRKLENALSSKAESMLVPLLGHGHAVVRVTADVDFTEKNTARTSYDPDTKVKARESISTETSKGASQRNGATGATSNMGSLALDGNAGGESSIETIDTEYQNTQIVDTVREAPGKIVRLTVAAVVELPEPDADADPAAGGTPAPQVTRDQVEKIIQQAVGFDPARNDEIEVMAARMTGVPDMMAAPGWATMLQDLTPLARSASLGIAAVVAFVLGSRTLKRMKPVVVEVDRSEAMDPEVRARLADLSEQMRQHPEAVSAVLAGWLAGQDVQAQPAAKRRAG